MKIKKPELPKINLPKEKTPKEKPPKEKAPKIKTPKEKVPKVKTPKEKKPKVKSETTDKKNSAKLIFAKFISLVKKLAKSFLKISKKIVGFIINKLKSSKLLAGLTDDTFTGKVSKLSSMRTHIIGSFSATIILMIVLGVVSYSQASSALLANYESSILETLDKTGNYYDLMLDTIYNYANDLAFNTTYHEFFNIDAAADPDAEKAAYNAIKNDLAARQSANSYISNIHIFVNGSRTLTSDASFNTLSPADFNATDLAAEVKKESCIWVSSHDYLDNIKRTSYSVSLIRTMLNAHYKQIGTIVLDVKYDSLHKTLDDTNLGEGSIAMLILPDGSELYARHLKDGTILTEATEEREGNILDPEFLASCKLKGENSGHEYIKFEKESHIIAYQLLDNDFAVVVLVPEDTITGRLSSISAIMFILVLVAIIAALFLGLFITKRITGSISTLSSGLDKVAGGDLTVHVNAKRRDEFSLLAKSTNQMISNTKQLIADTAGISHMVDEAALVFSENAEKLHLNSLEIKETINEIEQGIVTQATDAQNCMMQMDILADRIKKVSVHSSKIAGISNMTIDTVSKGISTISELDAKAADTERITNAIISSTQELLTASESIVEIVDAINEIADQTSLLSLNASIEAARAGEAGRGFSVVADEIRRLADQSATSANNIRSYVREIDAKTNAAVDFAKQSRKVVAEQQASLNATIKMFNDIETQVKELTDDLSKISNDINDIENSKNDTVVAIESISAISQQTAASSEEVLSVVSGQAVALEQFTTEAKNLTDNAEKLIESINNFKV